MDEDDKYQTAVMLGKMEVRLDQVLTILGQFDEVWKRLRDLELSVAALTNQVANEHEARNRRPTGIAVAALVASVLLGVPGIMLALFDLKGN